MQIKHLILDLDNTLYPATAEMEKGIGERMIKSVADFFKVDFETAKKIRHERITGFSTTLEWLRHEGLTDVEKFFATVHPNDEENELAEDSGLRSYLESIDLPKVILTNSPREHAERVLKKLNVQDLFIDVCDIRDCELLGKPYKASYEAALKKCGGNIFDSIFVDDMMKYTDGWKALGGYGILVGEKNGRPMAPDSPAVWKGIPERQGKIWRMRDIYQLKEKIEEITLEN